MREREIRIYEINLFHADECRNQQSAERSYY
jgi:hypothetical protein